MNRYRTTMLLPRPWDGTHFVADGFGVWLGAVEGASPERAVTETATTPEAKRAATPRAGDLLSRDVVARSLWIAGDTPPRSRLVSAQDLARQSVFHPTVWAVTPFTFLLHRDPRLHAEIHWTVNLLWPSPRRRQMVPLSLREG